MPGTSTPLAPDQIRAALRKFNVKFREIEGWETRNRGSRGNGWGPVYGFGVHHTGDDAADDLDRKVVTGGRSDLPGPLAQFGLNDDGTVDLIGCGRANHFGVGDPDVLAAVRDETYDQYPPKPKANTYDGNGRFYGVETYYSGSHVPAQYSAMVNLCAAICDAHGWTAKSVIGHKEWTNQKIDPGSVDMAQFRKDVNARIAAVNSGRSTQPAAPNNPVPQEDIMASLDDLRKVISDANLLTKADGGTLRADHAWQNNDRKARFEALTAAVQALADKVSAGTTSTDVAGIVDKAVRDRLSQVTFEAHDAGAAPSA